MLEEQLAFYLEKYLGNYVKGLSKEALKVSVWQGNVELTNMQLKPEALNALKLPIKVKAGFLGSVKLKVPWSRLGQEPVVVELDRIFILAEPATNVEGGDADSVQGAKTSRVRDEEEKLVVTKQDATKKEEASNSSWLGSLIGTVIGNLKLSITNIHIRYEDTESNVEHPFAAGLTLAKLAAVTVDESGKETFVTGGALDRIQKSGELNRLSFYFDTDTNPWPMEKSWEELVPKDWSKVFLPGIKEEPSAFEGEKPGWIQDHNYVLEPVGGIARYFKLGQKDTRAPEAPAQKAVAILDDVTISLSEKQYRDVLKLAENISTFTKRVQYAHYRPNVSILEDKKAWWHYAYTAISEDQKKARGHLSWQQILTYSRMRKQYVQKYIEVLQANPKATSVNDNKDIRDMDRQLDSEIIIQWRMLAHAFVDQERKKDEQERQAKSSWWPFGWGGGNNDPDAKEFTDDDWSKVNQIIGYQEGKPSPLVPGQDQPNMLHTLVEVQMKHNGTRLLSATGECILELTSEGLGCGIQLYPETKVFNVGLDSYKISTPEGLLGESATDEKSLFGTFTLSPWDKELDWALEAKAAPCYVTVLMQSINRITQFFSSKEAVSRDVALQTAAALQSTVNEVSKNAQQQLNDALKNKPKFSLDLDIAAPKVTIPTNFYPDGQHQCKMFLDLGYFTIKTLPEDGSINNSSEENQLYMRFRMGLTDISAFLVDGDFDWRKQYIVSSKTGRLQVEHPQPQLKDGKESENADNDNIDGKEEGASDNVQQVDESSDIQKGDRSRDNKGKGKCSDDSDSGDLFFLPMLEKTGMAIALEQICVPHPKYPTTRVAVRLQSLGFQISPARYHRIMQVVEVFSGGSTGDANDSAFRPYESPDFDGEMSVLSWKGVGHREAKWESRFGALAGPFLYLLESKTSRTYKTYHSLIGKKVFNVPKESVGGVENVLAICDAGQLDNKVAESANALLLRFEDENSRNDWQGRFAGAIYRASSSAAVTGILGGNSGKDDMKEDGSSSSESNDQKLAEQETIFLTGVLDELKIVVSNSLDIDHATPKLLLEPEKPLMELRAIGTKVEFVMRKYDMLVGAVLQSLEIEDKFHGHAGISCRYLARSYIKEKCNGNNKRDEHSSPEKDGSKGGIKQLSLNHGRKLRKAKLSQSGNSGDERFFDANDESGNESGSSSFSSHRQDSMSDAASKFYDAEDVGEPDESEPPSFKREVGLLPGSASPDPNGNNQDVTEKEGLRSFVKAQVIMSSQESPTYADIDKEVRVSLSTLSFYCNRPTVIAILDLVTAITADVQPKKDEDSLPDEGEDKEEDAHSSSKENDKNGDSTPRGSVEQAGQHNSYLGAEDNDKEKSTKKDDDANVDSQATSANADGIVTTINPKVVGDIDERGNPKIAMKHKDSVIKGLLGKGKDRVVMMLVLDMEFAEIVLNKEDGSKLSTLSQDNFHTEVKIYPASWGVKATLGNLRISDDNVKDYHGKGIPYQYICDMRDPGGSSFIELEFVSFNEDDLDYKGYEYSVTGKLSEVRVVFLNRFIQEITAYFMGLIPQSSGYVMKLKDRASNYEKLFSQSEIEGQPSLKLDLSLSKPIIILPRGTHSSDFMELDILHINIRSSSEWFGGGKEQLGAVRLETITLEVEDVSLTVGVGGKTGSEIFDRVRGINLLLRRPLRDLWHKVPVIEATVKIEELRVALSDKEYQVITECVTQNMAETPDLPPTLYDDKPLEDEKAKANDEAEKIEGQASDSAEVESQEPQPQPEKEVPDEGASSPEKPYTTIKVGVGISLVELGLFVGGTRDASLATIQVSGVWASYKANNIEESIVMASLERLSVRDDREGSDPEMRYMVGHADDESRNTLEGDSQHAQKNAKQKNENNTAVGTMRDMNGWGSGLTMFVVDAKLGPNQQQVTLRIQRPRLVVAFDFLLAVGEFFVPSMHAMLADKGDENPLDMKNGMFLNDRVYKQTAKEIQISPKKPLVADHVGILDYIYDGQGNTLRLLNRHGEDLSKYSPEALIFVGDGRRLVFRNLVIQNGDYLDSSIYLGSNSSYSASKDDGVFMEGASEDDDDSSSISSHQEEKKDDKKDDKPPVELMLDFQAIGPELTLYDSLNRPSDALLLPERHLRARMNIFARFSMKGDDMELTANLNGFTVESTSGVNVVEPFDSYVTYSKVTGKQNIHVGMTEIYTNFSFSILHLILRLQDDVMSIMRITSEQVTVECSEFEKIWADDDSQVEAGGSHLAFWRPRPPPGFAVLGDCFTPLDEPPSKGVLTLNMALARGKRPVGFKCVWSSNDLGPPSKTTRVQKSVGLNGQSAESSSHSDKTDSDHQHSDDEEGIEGCCVWLPIPPEGYVALGCVVCKGQEEPPKTAALCVLAALVSPCSMRDCINIQGQQRMSSSDSENWAFWRVDNSIGTFFTGSEMNQQQAYDLRLAIASYGAFTVKETVPSADETETKKHTQQLSSIDEGGEGQEEAAGLLTAVVSSGRIYENVGRFKLVWWDKGSASASKDGVSIWRPNVPARCAMLGDIVVKGYEPPSTGLVLRDTEERGLITKPEDFQDIGHLSKQRHFEGVTFWEPVAPPGYKTVGCIAGKGSHPDKDAIESIRCVRNDLVVGVKFADSSIWSTRSLKHGNQQLSIWPVENEAKTFFVKPGSYTSPPPDHVALGLADLRNQAEPDNLTVAVELKSASASFYDDFGGFMAPLLDFSIAGIQASLHGRLEALSATVNCSLTATTYNSKFDVWEPLVEPCTAFIRYEYSSDPKDKVCPTVSKVHIDTQDDMNVNVSVANANMLLEAYSSWTNLSKIEAGNQKRKFQDNSASSHSLSRRLTKHSTGSLDSKSNKSSFITAHNDVGEQLWIRTIEGSGRAQVMPLPPNGTAPIKLPVNHSMLDVGQKEMVRGRSGKFVAIRISGAELPEDQGIGGREYMAAIRIVPSNPATDSRQLQFQSARTRCVNPNNESGAGRVSVTWDEVFVFEVQSGEVNNAEIVVTDLARGIPVGFCPLSLSDYAKERPKSAGNEFKKSNPGVLTSFDLKQETLYPPKREKTRQWMRLALPQVVEGAQPTGCLLQPMARRDVFISGHSGEAMARSSITGDNVSLRIQSGIDMSAESLGLTATDCILIWQEATDEGSEEGAPISEEERYGHIGIALHFFSVYGEDEDEEDSEETESGGNRESSHKPGAIEVSVTKNGPWSPVRLNYGLGPAAWHLGKDHLASEMVVHEGVKHLFVRTLVTVSNETEYHLEFRLCPDFLLGNDKEGGDSSMAIDEALNAVEEEVFENQRHQPGKGWVSPTLSSDPGHWCTRNLSGSSKEFPSVQLPEHWVWMNDWRIDRCETVDQDGWAYGHDYISLKNWPPPSAYDKASTSVRRRRWIRSRQRKDDIKHLYIPLGTLEPHSTVPCPVESLRSGVPDYIVQVKPRNNSDNNTGVAHTWSSVVSYKGKPEMGRNKQPVKEIRVRGLQETEELLCCPVRRANSSELDKKDVWLCLECKATEIGKTSQLDPIQDWFLTVSAPLELVNFLPVSCKYKVFEKVAGNGSMELQSGSVEPGESRAIFHADLRKALYLEWIPEGGWRPKAEDILISHPGKESATEIIMTNGVRDLTIHMQHDRGNRGMSARVIQFYVPCWLDSAKCPSLKYKLVEVDHPGRKKFKTHRSRGNKKLMEEIDQEDMNEHPTMLSSFECKSVGLAVALSGNDATNFGPVVPLEPLADPHEHVELRVVDTEGSHFRFLVTTASHPFDFAQTRVVKLRPYTLFTNRLGLPLQLKQAGVDQSMTLQPWDWRTTFAFREVEDPLRLQIQLDGSDWSFPFTIENEETMHIVVRHKNGTRQAVRVNVRGHEDGSRYLAIFQLGSTRGPYRVENRTGTAKLKYRQVGLDESAWQTLRPHATASFAWENLLSEKLLEVIQDGRDPSRSTKIDISVIGDHPVVTAEESDSSTVCVRVLETPETKVIRFFDQEMETQGDKKNHAEEEDGEIEASVPTQGAMEPMQAAHERRPETPSQMEIVLGVGRLGFSVIDSQPRELIFLVMDDVNVTYATGLGENVSRFTVTVGYMQVDNQLPLTSMPVLLAPDLHNDTDDFVIKAISSMKSGTAEAIQVYPYMGLKLTGSAWHINVHEAIVWAFLEMYNNLHLDRLSSDSQVVQVDPEIQIETLDISEVRLKLSVETSPDQRPQGKLGIWGPAVSTIGNISKMPIHFRSAFRENRRMRKSQVQAQILNRVKRDLIHQPLQLLTGVNILGMTSSTLGTMSRGAANLSKDDDFMQVRANQEKSRKVKGVGDGVVQGTESFARGITSGVKGIVTKPMDGAHDRGAVGCIQGVFKAFVGVVVQPLSGCLDFMALSVSGIGTSCTNCFEIFEHDAKFQRIRLPRAIKGDGVLTPYDGYAARGQAILQLAQSGAYFGSKDVFKNSAKYAFSDFYQEHFYLPDNHILMITNRRILMLLSPRTHAKDEAKELTDPCTIQWEIQWPNLMAMEDANGQNSEVPTQVLLHLRHSSKQFTNVVWCFPPKDGARIPQASEIYKSIHHQWRAFCPTPEDPSQTKKAKRFRRRPKPRPVWDMTGRKSSGSSQANSSRSNGEAETSGSGKPWEGQRPPDDDGFRLETSLGTQIWTQDNTSGSCLGATGGDVLSFWRPTPPPGYVSVGDIAYCGDYPDSQTVITYRNDEDKFEKPLGFELIWRNWKDGLGSPISIWMPQAPDGYTALGCVVCADYQEPDLDCVWCADSSLTGETSLEEAAIWKAPSEAPWHCYLYPVKSEARTFIALRGEKDEETPKPRRVAT